MFIMHHKGMGAVLGDMTEQNMYTQYFSSKFCGYD